MMYLIYAEQPHYTRKKMKIPLFHLEKINLKSAFLKEKRRRPGMQKKFKKKHKTDYHIHTHRTFEPD